MQNLKKLAGKPLINAGVSAIAISTLAGEQRNFIYGDRVIPVTYLGAAMGVASSVAVETVSNLIVPHISKDSKLKHLESMVLHIAGSGMTVVGAAYLLNNNLNMDEARKFFVAGVLSETQKDPKLKNSKME